MKFSFEWIKELGKLQITANEAADLLNTKACETELTEDGNLEADILPNRPDLLSHIGLARELAALTDLPFGEQGTDFILGSDGPIPVTIDDAKACPRYAGTIVRGVAFGPSPKWLSERLESLGVGSVNNVVDVVNLVMLEVGQPMHAFDVAKLRGGIRVRYAKKGESIQALDDARTRYELDPSILVIADDSGPIAIAGIKGGASTAISDQTQDVFLESAVFDSSVVKAGSTRLNLRTDASVRFSYGVSRALAPAALSRAVMLLEEITGGKADEPGVEAYPHPWQPQKLILKTDYVRSLLGADIQTNDIVSILSSLGFAVAGNEGQLEVSAPQWRLDVERQEDLIEEVGRVYGYENIPSLSPVVHAFDDRAWLKEDEDVPWDEYGYIRERQRIVRLMAAHGYTEVYNYAFIPDDLKETLHLDHSVELMVPQSEQYRWLRTSLLPRLIGTARDNLRFAKTTRLMETGHVFDHVGQGMESTRFGLIIAKTGKAEDLFYELKGAVDTLMRELGITDVLYDDTEPFDTDPAALNLTVPSRRSAIKDSNGDTLGFMGQVDARAAATLRLKGTAAVAELNLRRLVRHAQAEREFAPLPRYPAVERDISILVADEIRILQILETIRNADSSGLVQDVDVMDIFVPTGDEKLAPEFSRHEYGKSISVRVVYRSDERTLTDEEVTVVEDAIKRALQDELSAQIR